MSPPIQKISLDFSSFFFLDGKRTQFQSSIWNTRLELGALTIKKKKLCGSKKCSQVREDLAYVFPESTLENTRH